VQVSSVLIKAASIECRKKIMYFWMNLCKKKEKYIDKILINHVHLELWLVFTNNIINRRRGSTAAVIIYIKLAKS
jgi:hypothetical protein